MRFLQHPLLRAALAAAICAAPAAAQDPAPATAVQPDFAAEFSALQKEYQQAQQAFYDKYSSLSTDEERGALLNDPAQSPNVQFAPRIRAFAERAGSHESAGSAWVFLLGLAPDQEECAAVAARVAKDFLHAPASEGLAQWLRYGSWQIGREPAIALLRALEGSGRAETRAGAAFALACNLMDGAAEEQKEARALFERLPKEFAETPYAAQASGYLFELDHLQIGMTAPEIEGTDSEGKAFKLSEYRGQVVVLDFWGFW